MTAKKDPNDIPIEPEPLTIEQAARRVEWMTRGLAWAKSSHAAAETIEAMKRHLAEDVGTLRMLEQAGEGAANG